jgi:hypothetical protein
MKVVSIKTQAVEVEHQRLALRPHVIIEKDRSQIFIKSLEQLTLTIVRKRFQVLIRQGQLTVRKSFNSRIRQDDIPPTLGLSGTSEMPPNVEEVFCGFYIFKHQLAPSSWRRVT